jgi:predicted RNA-binding Zn-ribbon protein involved in translation (DUF1610 family)
MNDFIAMSCPSCGGKLNISPNTTTLICQHCGTEHMVRWQAGSVLLESFARCPQCNRNDRVQKISAILGSQNNTRLVEKLSPPSRPTLPPQPQPPLEKKQTQSAIETIAASVVLGLFGCASISIVSIGYEKNQEMACYLVPLGIFLCSVALINLNKNLALGEPSLHKKRLEEYNRNLTKWKVLAKYHDIAIDEWDHFMKHWDKLYYCNRDDCVFIPNTNTFAPSSGMIEYLKNMYIYI